ncbi:MAG: response regulator [Armatimonadetes bacterium]|nr:response regulator [Armatimonadota bacterium]
MSDRPEGTVPSAPPESRISVLVVDDNAAHAHILVREIEGRGSAMRAVAAASLAQARAIIAQTPPSVAIVDLNLPDGLATELLTSPAEDGPFPVIIMTAAGSEEMAAAAIRAGAHDYLVKSPQVFADIGRTIRAALREWRHMQAGRVAVEALAASEAQYRELLDATGDGIFVKCPDLRYVLANAVHVTRLDMEAAELMGRTDAEFMEPDEAEAFAAIDRSVLATGESVTFETTHQGREYETRKFPVRLTDGRTGVAGYVRDITAPKAAAAEMARLAAAVDQFSESVMITEPDGSIVYANPAFERISGYTRAEVMGRNPRIWKSGLQDARFYADLWSTLREGRTWRGRFINRRKDGSLFHEDAILSPLLGGDGQLVGYAAVKRDVTDDVLAERAQRQGQKLEALGTLAAGIAHDFNNVLQNIMTMAENSLSDVPEASPAGTDLESILEACRRAGGLIRQIRIFTHSEEQERLEAIDPAPLISEALRLMRGAVPASVSLHAVLPPAPCRIVADPVQLHQVVMNLCTNACQSVPRGQRAMVTVSLSLEQLDALGAANVRETAAGGTASAIVPGRFVVLRIEDTGAGIPRENLDRIFDPYFSTKSEISNTGLGLAVVHGIIRAHHAAITVQSEPGAGSVFSIYFAAAEDEAGAAALVSLAAVAPPTGSETLMYVDDEPGICKASRRSLERLGYRVAAYTSPVEALERLRAEPGTFDMLVTDLAMPEMSGLELYTQAKAAQPRMRAIVCTGFSDQAAADAARAASVSAVLTKPIPVREIAVAVRSALDAPRAEIA